MKEYIIPQTSISADGYKPCIKQQVYAMITKNNVVVFGTNKMLNSSIK